MNCINCKKEIEDNSKFCPYCGHSFLSIDEKLANLNKEENLEILLLIKIGIVILAFGLVLFLLAG